jgi:hypothetical protein
VKKAPKKLCDSSQHNNLIMAEKRKDTSVAGALIKRAKQDNEETNKSLITLSNERSGTKNAIVGTVRVIFIHPVYFFLFTQ